MVWFPEAVNAHLYPHDFLGAFAGVLQVSLTVPSTYLVSGSPKVLVEHDATAWIGDYAQHAG